MNIDLHNHNDDLYRKAYERLEEEPSAEVWDKVLAKLDSRDAQYYQQKSIRWKRTALLLLLLLGTVLLTGTMYIAIRKESPLTSNVKENDKYAAANNKPPAPARFNDSNTFSHNINQPSVDVKEPNQTSGANTDVPASSATPGQPADKASHQVDTPVGKQYPEPLQNSSVAAKEAALQQQVSTTPNRNSIPPKMVLERIIKQANTTSLSKEKEAGYRQRNVLKQPSPSNSFLALERNWAYSKNRQQFGLYQSDDSDDGKEERFLFQSLFLNGFSSYALSHKEVVDSNTLAEADALVTTLQKSSAREALNATGNKKTVSIAPLQKQRLQLTGYASFDVAEYHLDDDDEYHDNNNQQPAAHRENRRKIKDRETHGLSFSAGIVARWQAGKKLSLTSGLSYSSITINSNPQTLYATQNGNQSTAYKLVTSSGYAYIKSSGSTLSVGDSAKTGMAQQQLQFLSVPVMAGYTLYSSRHFSITPSLGAAANFLTGTRVYTEISEPASAKEAVTLTRLNGLQHWYPSLLADAEVQYHFKKNMSLTFLPAFRYAVRPLTQNNAVKTSPYSFGLGLGFTYHF